MIRSFALLLLSVGALLTIDVTPVVSEEAPRLSRPCERNSECSAPNACVSGRCREECREDRDCGAGRQCVVVESGTWVSPSDGLSYRWDQHACQLITPSYIPPEAAMCTAPRDCTSGGCSADHQCTGG